MALSLNQVQAQKQLQRLVMTPQMQQSIQLLQMTSLELEQLATQEMLQNPFLELVEEGDDEDERGVAEEVDGFGDADTPEDGAGEGERSEDPGEPKNPDEMHLASMDLESEPDRVSEPGEQDPAVVEHFDDVDADWDSHYDGDNAVYTPPNPDEEDRDYQEYVGERRSLYDTLKWQLGIAGLSARDRQIGEYIIGSIDEDGYMRVSMDELASEIGCTVAEAEAVLRVVHGFDPVGVGARDLAECLTLQLEALGEKDSLVFTIVGRYLEMLQKKKFREIAKDLLVDEEAVRAVFHKISHLEPMPGRSRSADEVRYALPDVLVRKVDEDYVVFMNEGRTSGLRLNQYYRQLLSASDLFSSQEKEFAQEKLKSAVWLLRNIEKRKNTILKVSEAIMDFQREFLEKGTHGLRPLTLREIAEVVGMHESTVARVTTGKYIDTPRGVYELKYFFSPGLQTDYGEDASSTSIKEMLNQMIAAEEPRRPLSDQRLAEMLQERGITIARRTVAKYREQLRILSAKLRRQV